jgi:hypothetical protein
VPFSRDISGDFHAIGQAYSSYFAESGVRLLWSGSGNFRANASLERRREKDRSVFKDIESASQSDGLRLGFDFPSIFLD